MIVQNLFDKNSKDKIKAQKKAISNEIKMVKAMKPIYIKFKKNEITSDEYSKQRLEIQKKYGYV